MILQKKIRYAIVGSVAFLVIYLFAAAVPLSDDFYFQPEWTRSIINAPPIGAAGAEGLRAFMLGDEFGFFSSSGEVYKGNAGGLRFSAGGGAWCVYAEDARSTEVRGADGSLKMTVNAAGFVHLTENGVYLFHPGGGAVSRYAEDGNVIWTREEAAPITAFSDSAAGTIMGFGSGLLLAVDAEGRNLFSFYPGGSEHSVVVGAAISQDGRLAVCVSGINPQRVLLIEIENRQQRITAHRNIDGELRRQVFVGFSASGDRAFFETPAGLGILDTQARSFSEVPIGGRVLNVVEYSGTGFFAALAKTNPGSHALILMQNPAVEVSRVSFECQDAFLLFADGGLCLGTDGNISKVNIRTAKDMSR